MITVELDIFSGNPNPVWKLTKKEENELIARVSADPSLTQPPKKAGRLGYRGFTISAGDEASERLKKSGLPSRFYLSSKSDARAETSLLNSSEAEKNVPDDVLQLAQDTINTRDDLWQQYWATHRDIESDASDIPTSEGFESLPGAPAPDIPLDTPPPAENLAPEACGVIVELDGFNFNYWNDSYSVSRNNCYNFAANYRSHTYAQPGRKSNIAHTALDCANYRGSTSFNAAYDGFNGGCWAGRHYVVYLVIWPGRDYHWYRRCRQGVWGNKVGTYPADNRDFAERIITNITTCNHGPYTYRCGYRYFPEGWTVR